MYQLLLSYTLVLEKTEFSSSSIRSNSRTRARARIDSSRSPGTRKLAAFRTRNTRACSARLCFALLYSPFYRNRARSFEAYISIHYLPPCVYRAYGNFCIPPGAASVSVYSIARCDRPRVNSIECKQGVEGDDIALLKFICGTLRSRQDGKVRTLARELCI